MRDGWMVAWTRMDLGRGVGIVKVNVGLGITFFW